MKIGCLGMATLDTLLFTGNPVYDHEAVTPVERDVVSVGGKGIVCAIAMQRAGAEAVPFAMLARVSELKPLLPPTLDTQHLLPLLDRDNRTWIMISAAHKVVTFVTRRPLGVDEETVAIAAVEEFIRQVDVLYLTVEDPALIRVALKATMRNKVTLALNPSLPFVETLLQADPALLQDAVRQSAFILCNDWEAPRFLHSVGAGGWTELDAPLLEDVVVTAGARGGSFSCPPFEDWKEFPATPAEEVRCVVGAGDTFNGAYLTGRLAHGLGASESCRRAADLAAIKVAQRSSALLPPTEGA